jgi:hypothetical protein
VDGNQQQIIRNEEYVEAEQPEQTTVTQTERNAGYPPVTGVSNQSTVQTTTATTQPSDEVATHNVSETVVDPAADRAAGVDLAGRIIWFVVGVMAVLLAIRFVLLLSGANESAGFAQLIYGLTGWMVAPFMGLFGNHLTYPGAASTAVFEPESLVAIAVYVLIGLAITKLAQMMLGTNRTTGTVYSETERRTKL